MYIYIATPNLSWDFNLNPCQYCNNELKTTVIKNETVVYCEAGCRWRKQYIEAEINKAMSDFKAAFN